MSKHFVSIFYMRRIVAVVLTVTILSGFPATMPAGYAQNDSLAVTWWIVGSTLKVVPDPISLTDPDQELHLYTARQEYAPFQVVIRTAGQSISPITLAVEYPSDVFELTLYQEVFLDMTYLHEDETFALGRLSDAALPDGLQPLQGPLSLPPGGTAVIWADLYVRPDAAPGDYPLTLTLDGAGSRQVTVTVYPVDLAPTPSMSVIVPIGEPNWTMDFFAPGNPAEFQRAVNALLLEHALVPGDLVGQARLTDNGWDFSGLDAELDALPPGAIFHPPGPYDGVAEEYLFPQPDGTPYTVTDFSDAYFVEQLGSYFFALAEYLRGKDRLEGALVWPFDETRWVGDEPIHNGAPGYQHLANWTAVIRSAGLRVRGSLVTPLPPGPPELGWPSAEATVDDVHVPVDLFDAIPQVFTDWASQPGHSTSLYLNDYGDKINVSAAIHRGLIWHAYAYGIRDITGYAAMEWVDKRWDLVDPWTDPDQLYPQAGYGGGALVWPGPLPSLRLKLLREGVEDARLLDLYAQMTDPQQARDFAACLMSGPLAEQNPPANLWDDAHTALLMALSTGQPVVAPTGCAAPKVYTESQVMIDMDRVGRRLSDWDLTGVEAQIVPSPRSEDGNWLVAAFTEQEPVGEAGLWVDHQDWSGWEALQINVSSPDPYLTSFTLGITDDQGNYLVLGDSDVIISPGDVQTITLPLRILPGQDEAFNWSSVTYLSLQVNTVTEWENSEGELSVYPTGARTLTFDNFTLVR